MTEREGNAMSSGKGGEVSGFLIQSHGNQVGKLVENGQ